VIKELAPPSPGPRARSRNFSRKPGRIDRKLGIHVPAVSIRQPNGFPPWCPLGGVERETAVKISCPSCQAKYSIADEKVQDRLAKIRCRKCGTTIVIDGKVSPASVYAADAGADASPETGGSAAVEQPGSSAGAQASGVEYTVD